MPDMPPLDPVLVPDAAIHGFVVRRATPIPGLRSVAYELEHAGSGARIMHIHNQDSENLFSVSFLTPPTDDTGVPHIIEHAVLSGSQRYPVRDPFFEMVKMSMATFINAMTATDHTLYPVCSNVRQDLFNLADVYFDAVFHPLLSETTFKREGHHLAPADPEKPLGELSLNGIVYSEMQGAFSSPEALLFSIGQRELFPDTPYRHESGGHPAAIPQLTYGQFREFWQSHYHPSNACFIFYGNIPTADYLAFLEPKLAGYQRQPALPPIPAQPRWNQPRLRRETYPVDAGEKRLKHKTFLTINWLVGDATDPAFAADMDIVNRLILGHEGAPLRKALIDAKLGQDLVHSGDLAIGRESTFAVGIKGSDEDKLEAFASQVLKTLAEIADATFPASEVEAAFQQAAYDVLEICDQYPLQLLDDILSTWIYARDPLTYLHDAEHLDACRQRWERDPRCFNAWIRRHLIGNQHRLTLVLAPEPGKQERENEALAAKLAVVRAGMSEAEAEAIAATAAQIDDEAGTSNTQEQLATLPQLRLSDLPKAPATIPYEIETLPYGVELLCPDVFSNGINYLVLNIDLTGLPADLWVLLPRYADALEKMGTAKLDYAATAARVAAVTGGLGVSVVLSNHAENPEKSVCQLRISAKTLDQQLDAALEILRDLIFTVNPRDRSRLEDVVTQAYTAYRSSLVNNGSRTAGTHAARGFSPVAWVAHLMHGLPQFEQTARIRNGFAGTEAESLMSSIERIRDFLLNRARLTVAFTGSPAARLKVISRLREWTALMSAAPVEAGASGFEPYATPPPAEGLAGPMQVAHCVRIFRAPCYRDPRQPLVTLGAHFLSHDYLLPEIRFKGNAYGAGAGYSTMEGRLGFSSFRDPQIVRTLKIFDAAPEYIRRASWSRADLERAIIGTAKNSDRPIRPESATAIVLSRHTQGITEALRRQHYEGLLGATVESVRQTMLDVFENGFADSAICVASNPQKLAKANEELDRKLAIRNIIPE